MRNASPGNVDQTGRIQGRGPEKYRIRWETRRPCQGRVVYKKMIGEVDLRFEYRGAHFEAHS